ncbi:hypothetical protein LCGC14_2174520 [marine sediment metagenome]|uniref:Uncharacterized protein n=1 Tax=marine sediment metagenome TaxID=412755 RepID=A0A0F9EBA8_9ZZZZ
MTHTPWTVESCRDTLPGSIEGSRVFADNAPEGDKLIAQCYGSRAIEYAQLIAAAPETAAERDRLKAINAELVTGLGFYANEKRYEYDTDCCPSWPNPEAKRGPRGGWLKPKYGEAILSDNGEKARAAIAKHSSK